MDVKDLSPAQCVLLAVHLATESNIKALHSFTPGRPDALSPELVLRILLTYLPESLDPRDYTTYVQEVASRLYLDVERENVQIDTSLVRDIPDQQAQKRVRKLRLRQLKHPDFSPHAPDDLLTRFLCHRAHCIDTETGMLHLLPALVEPFIDRNRYLRTWYISVVLPLLRYSLEYYPESEGPPVSIGTFEPISGAKGIDILMGRVVQAETEPAKANVARDIKGLVGPWMYGHTERKRRKLDSKPREVNSSGENVATDGLSNGMRRIALAGVTEEDKTGHDWEYMYQWLVSHAVDRLDLVMQAVEDWDGPGDVDLGGFERGEVQYLDEEVQIKLELQYAQAAIAACYAAKGDDEETVRNAHAILARLALLLDFVPPPDLATSVESLPLVEGRITQLEEGRGPSLTPEALLEPNHPLTTPKLEIYMLLQMVVYSAYQLCGLGHPSSLARVAKLHFQGSVEEQLDLLRKLLEDLRKLSQRKDESSWMADRARLVWLWNWGIEAEANEPGKGYGVLGRIPRDVFEKEFLQVLVETSGIDLAAKLYVADDSQLLSRETVEKSIYDEAMKAYDGASNGNRTRGGVKKANEIITAFKRHFSDSELFRQASALIAATHSLSFYSLTLQHGVPFQPVSIRVSTDPISLIDKVLEQNPRSYAKLDDLIDIARNLVSARLVSDANDDTVDKPLSGRVKDAEQRVIFMAVEAALREDDFETAYSYIINRLTPSDVGGNGPRTTTSSEGKPQPSGHIKRISQAHNKVQDDMSWRAAFLAGRYRPTTSSPPSLRRLEQRTELLSLALLLAPVSALTEILAAWRRCEEETTSLQLSQEVAEDEFDDRADQRFSGGIPGNFTVSNSQPDLIMNQKRREMGRLGAHRGDDEAPLSMFDLTRSAARAFSNNAFPLRGARVSSDQERDGLNQDVPSSPTQDSQRLRKRDMVASAVSGGLASGLGWVLGATPVNQQQQGHQHQSHEG